MPLRPPRSGRSSPPAPPLALLVATAFGDDVRADHRRVALGFAVLYGVAVGVPQARALAAPDAARVRAATGAGIGGLTLLQAGWLAAGGRLLPALLVASAAPLLRRAARTVSPT